jgi:hypothetical protein
LQHKPAAAAVTTGVAAHLLLLLLLLLPVGVLVGLYVFTCSCCPDRLAAAWWMGPAVPAAVMVEASSFKL